MSDRERGLVYSTDGGRQIDKTVRARHPAAAASRIPDDGIIRVFRENRRGSSVTLITGLLVNEVATIGAELRRRCATGGTTKNWVIELRGDHRDAVIAYFERAGRRAKKAGG